MGFWEAIWKSFLLGTVQGLTEFLPVSSSGHLTLLQKILGYDVGGSMTFVNITMHFGTLLPIVVIFWKDILALFQKPFKTLVLLVVATIPAGITGLLLNDKIDALFAGERGLLYLSLCFAFTAFLLLVCEFVAKRQKRHRPLGWMGAIAMGLTQVVALFPGISRSGSTITAGTLSWAKTQDVAKFSFLMSIPIILGSLLLGIKDMIQTPAIVTRMGAESAVGLVVGVATSAICGFFAIKMMLKVIRKANYKWFSCYLVVLSLTCFWLDALAVL